MEYVFALLGLLAFILIDLGALNRATPEINFIETVSVYFKKNILFVILCLLVLYVVVSLKADFPFLPEQFQIVEGKSPNAICFVWGIGIQFILIQVRKMIFPIEAKP